MGERIRVEGRAADLEALRHELEEELGDEINTETISAGVPGELREPVVVALIVAVASTASVAIKTVGSVIERRMLHQEVMERFRIYGESQRREISVAELIDEKKGPAITVIDIGRQLLDDCALDEVIAIFAEAESTPDVARRVQGTMAFRFPEQETKGDEMWLDPSVRAFGRALYERLPHILYFMSPEPGMGAMVLLVHSFDGFGSAPRESPDGTEWTPREEGLWLVSRHLLSAAFYAESLAEDWRTIIPRLAATLEPRFGEEVMHIVERVVAEGIPPGRRNRSGDDCQGAGVDT
jgi:hypothetical protein